MYRAVTWAALEAGIPIEDEGAVTALAERLQIDILPAMGADGRSYTVVADGTDITWAIRESEVDANVSAVSAYSGVRSALVPQQRRVAARGPVVMIGRDIGTVVLPDADLKVYLDATAQERAHRRWRELMLRGLHVDCDSVLAAVLRRDDIDSHREVSPLKVAGDAIVVDTTDLSVGAVVERLHGLIEDCECPQA
jgi:cytidylate kinase